MENSNIQADMRDAIGEMNSAIQSATAQMRGDLDRLRAVVRDATSRLDVSFQALREVLGRHRELLTSVAKVIHDATPQSQSFAASSDALLQQFIGEIVRVSRDSMRIIEQLAALSTQVDGIVTCADDIDRLARETRFVAFNARIETHRAGEAGRTFKVVADEVMRLANASSGLSNQIRLCVSECRNQLQQLGSVSEGLASHDMGRAVESHTTLAGAVSKLDAVSRTLDTMLDRVDSSVADATRALQFEDMAAQLIATTWRRIETLASLMMRALTATQRAPGEGASELRRLAAEVGGLSASSSVQQRSVEQGSVELF